MHLSLLPSCVPFHPLHELLLRHHHPAANPQHRKNKWGPRKAALWLCGERRRNGANELSALAGSERCGVCADDVATHRTCPSPLSSQVPYHSLSDKSESSLISLLLLPPQSQGRLCGDPRFHPVGTLTPHRDLGCASPKEYVLRWWVFSCLSCALEKNNRELTACQWFCIILFEAIWITRFSGAS